MATVTLTGATLKPNVHASQALTTTALQLDFAFNQNGRRQLTVWLSSDVDWLFSDDDTNYFLVGAKTPWPITVKRNPTASSQSQTAYAKVGSGTGTLYLCEDNA